VIEELPAWFAAPVGLALIGVASYQRRHALLGWLGFKKDEGE